MLSREVTERGAFVLLKRYTAITVSAALSDSPLSSVLKSPNSVLLLRLLSTGKTDTPATVQCCCCMQVMGDTLLHLSRAAFEDYAAYITQCAAARVVIVSPANVRVTRPTPKTGSQTGSTVAAVQSPPLFKVALQKSAAPVGAGTYVFEYDSPPEAFVAAVLATFDAAVQVCTLPSIAATAVVAVI
jgi:hypothetical protein